MDHKDTKGEGSPSTISASWSSSTRCLSGGRFIGLSADEQLGLTAINPISLITCPFKANNNLQLETQVALEVLPMGSRMTIRGGRCGCPLGYTPDKEER